MVRDVIFCGLYEDEFVQFGLYLRQHFVWLDTYPRHLEMVVSKSFHKQIEDLNENIQEMVVGVFIALNENILPECFRGVA